MNDKYDLLEVYIQEYIDNMFLEHRELKDYWFYYIDYGIIFIKEPRASFPNTYEQWLENRV